MESNEIGPRMRGAFEAVLPSEEAVLRRHGKGLGLRGVEDLPNATRVSSLDERRHVRRGVAVALGGLLAAAGVLLVWSLTIDRPVAIEPSLTRDLRAGLAQKKDAPAPVVRAESKRSVDSVQPAPTLLPAPAEQRRPRVLDLAPDPAPAPQTSSETDAGWARVTEAMRQRDWAAAQAALAPLLDSSDEETKDSARLVRVRLELGAAQSQSADARSLAELEDLAKAGSTSSIRASARRLLESLGSGTTKHPTPDRELPPVEE